MSDRHLRPRRIEFRFLSAMSAVALLAFAPNQARADEGGVGMYLPGSFGSLAAVPGVPGWAVSTIYYHASVSGAGNVAAARQATIGRFNPTVNINLNATLDARSDLDFVGAAYTFASPVLGGQLTLGMLGGFGRTDASIAGTLTASVGPLSVTRSGVIDDARWGIADLFPQAMLKWNSGVNNYMVYMMGNIPVGTYDPSRLANFGLGHGAIDGGGGYTYFNPKTGWEFSAVAGMTYNFENTDTDYRNGVDFHVDYAASKFLSKQLHVGLVGYYYQQLTADSGQPLILGDFKSRIAGIGPQIGYLFPVGDMQGYVNLKGYGEFAAQNRADGWNLWLTFALSPKAPEPATPAPRRPMVYK
jgi:hypothetical protein